MSLTISDGQSAIKDPNSVEVYVWDWDAEHLAASAEISTSTFTITGPDSTLTQDEASILSGNRKAQVRLTGGTVGKVYTVTNRIVTNETPAQTKDASLRLLIRER
jgi:hypothetical protein